MSLDWGGVTNENTLPPAPCLLTPASAMHTNKPAGQRTWREKFGDAFHGVKAGVRGQSSFFVHFFMAALVLAAAAALGVHSLAEWGILLLCITVVLTAEMFNSAIESLARAITRDVDPHVGAALDIGSAAVLLASIGAAIVGAAVLANRLGMLMGWWSGL
jgi:diacylglycerol kinase